MSCGKVLCIFDNGDDVQEELTCGTTGPNGVGVHLCKDCRDDEVFGDTTHDAWAELRREAEACRAQRDLE